MKIYDGRNHDAVDELEVAVSMSVFDARPALRDAVLRSSRATMLPVVFGGPVNHDGVLLSESVGMRTGALDGLLVSRNHGLGGHAVLVRRPVSVTDYRASSRISHEYDRQVGTEGLVAVTAVPVLVLGRARAVLFGAVRDSAVIGGRAIDELVKSAAALGKQLELAERKQGSGSRLCPPTPDGRQDADAVFADLRQFADMLDVELRNLLLKTCSDDDFASRGSAEPKEHLTARELLTLSLVDEGCANRDVAAALCTSEPAVKAQLRNAMRKLGVASRQGAVSAARAQGLLP